MSMQFNNPASGTVIRSPDIKPAAQAAPPGPAGVEVREGTDWSYWREAGGIPPLVIDIVEMASNDRLSFTDIHIQPGEQMRIKTPGNWTAIGSVISEEQIFPAVRYFLNFEDSDLPDGVSMRTFIDEHIQALTSYNTGFNLEDVRLRIDISKIRRGIEMVIRKFPKRPIEFSKLIIPPQAKKQINLRSGLYLVNGQTGSGKTMFIASALEHFNQMEDPRRHIVTIEDPIEYEFSNGTCVFSQKEVGIEVPSFSAAARAALRQNPDVLMISEIRDRETAEVALQAAQSCLVLTTTHGTDTVSSFQRMIDYFSGEELSASRRLARCLIGSLSLALIPNIQRNRFVSVCEFASGDNEVVMTALEENKLTALREVMRKFKEGERPSKDMDGLFPMNMMLSNLLGKETIDLETARRTSPDQRHLIELETARPKIAPKA